MRKIRMLFLEPHLGVVGGIRHIMEYANYFQESGKYDVSVATPIGEHCSWLPFNGEFVSLKDTLNYFWDIVLFNDPSPEQIQYMNDVTATLKVHLLLAYEPGYREGKLAEIAKESYFQPWYKLANSSFTSNCIKDHIGIEVPVIGLGINPNHFYPYKTNKTSDVICCSPPERSWKGYTIIKKACELSKVSLRNISGLGIPQCNLGKEYSKGKVFISAAKCEGFSLPSLEAMACGVPVITCNEGGNLDYVKHLYNCYLVKERTPEEFSKAIDGVLRDTKLQKQLIKGGLNTVKEGNYDWEYRSKLLEYYLLVELNKIRKQDIIIKKDDMMKINKDKIDIVFIRYNCKDMEQKALDSIISITNRNNISCRIFDIDNYDAEKKTNIKSLTTWWNELTNNNESDYVCYINTDTIIRDPEWLNKMCDILKSDPRIAAVGPMTNTSYLPEQLVSDSKYKSVTSKPGRQYKIVQDLSGFCFLLKKSVWRRLGGFNPKFTFYGAETEFFHRVNLSGLKVAVCENTFVYHEGAASLREAEKRGEMSEEAERNKGRALYKKYLETTQKRSR